MEFSVSLCRKLVLTNNFVDLKNLLMKTDIAKILYVFLKFSSKERLLIFNFLDKNKAMNLFKILPFDFQCFILINLPHERIYQIISMMKDYEIVYFVKKLPINYKNELFHILSNDVLSRVNELLSYKDGTAASLMSLDYISFNEDMTVNEAINILKTKDYFDGNIFFVCRNDLTLVGYINLHFLFKSDGSVRLKDIMLDFLELSVDRDDCDINFINKHSVLAVVNESYKLLGVIPKDILFNIYERQYVKDIYSLGRIFIDSKDDSNYFNYKILDLFKVRVVWILFLLVFDFLTVYILKKYEFTISQYIPIVFFIPMVLFISTNISLQVSVSISNLFNAISLININMSMFLLLLRKEFVSSLLLALISSIVVFVMSYAFISNIFMSIFVCLSFFIVIIISTMISFFVTFILKKIKLGIGLILIPLIVNIASLVGLILYLLISTNFLSLFLGVNN